jgi:hypothetical protein
VLVNFDECEIGDEIVFASDYYGSGVIWPTTAGMQDQESIVLLRSIQRKLVRIAGRPTRL